MSVLVQSQFFSYYIQDIYICSHTFSFWYGTGLCLYNAWTLPGEREIWQLDWQMINCFLTLPAYLLSGLFGISSKCKELCQNWQSLFSLTRAKLSLKLMGVSPDYQVWDSVHNWWHHTARLQMSHTSYIYACNLICLQLSNFMSYCEFIWLEIRIWA